MDTPSHLTIGPLYCETPLTAASAVPIEWVNTLTSFIPALLGVLAVVWLLRMHNKRADLWALAMLTVATGLGSAWWHGARTGVALAFDVFPGLLYFLLILYLWPAYLFGKKRALVLVLLFAGSVFLLGRFGPFAEANGPPPALFAVVLLFAVGYLYVSYRRLGRDALVGVLMIGCALLAATFRTIDVYTCDVLPFGTHFLWHTFLGLAAYLGVRFLALFGRHRGML